MPDDRIVIANFTTGYETDREPFLINNDAFPVLNNAYEWRGRILRKRGISLLGRLQDDLVTQALGITDGGGAFAGNIFTIFGIDAFAPNASLVLGSIEIIIGDQIYYDPTPATGGFLRGGIITGATQANPCEITSIGHNLTTGNTVTITQVQGMIQLNGLSYTITVTGVNTFTLDGIDSTGFGAYTMGGIWRSLNAATGTINYQTGDITIQTNPVLAATAVLIDFSFYLALPVLGLEDFDIGFINQEILISFDTKLSYGFNQGTNLFYNVNFYKSTGEPFQWQGADFQQFYSANYLGVTSITDTGTNTGCLWATNGNPGFHFITIASVTVAAPDTPASVSTITTTANHNLTDDDFVFINEVPNVNATAVGSGAPPRPASTFGGINGASAQVTVLTPNSFSIPTPYTNGASPVPNGIVQYLTRATDTTGDGIRWYDGDPTVSTDFGWVNFSPPLSQYDSVNNPNPQYLVGAKIVFPFKNRLLFFNCYLRTSKSSPGNQLNASRLVYSQVGTPYYSLPLPFPLLGNLPNADAWFQNVAGKGGFLTAPIEEQVVTVDTNEDLLIVGFETRPLKLISTGDDILPFVYQTISSELGSFSTYASITLDIGTLYIGEYGIALVTSTSAQRIDLQIPDQVFEIARNANQTDRITAVRDYQKELIYFTFPLGQYSTAIEPQKVFPSRTFLYNYRENTWATMDENFTRYGTFRRTTNRTWANIGQIYPTWSVWNDPWSYGANQSFFPTIVGGNQQGFVMEKGLGTAEGRSQYIQAVSGITITSPDHNLTNNDFIFITGMLGSTELNNTVQQITVDDTDNFTVNDPSTGIYLGGGVYSRLSLPFIQTKQFPNFWGNGTGIRLGTQRFLLSANSTPKEGDEPPQITVNVYSSQNNDNASNDPAANSYLAFSNIVLTCAEPENLYSSKQDQIWHRQSSSFNGDTVQLAFTLSNDQMRDMNINQQEITLHAIVLDVYRGPVLL